MVHGSNKIEDKEDDKLSRPASSNNAGRFSKLEKLLIFVTVVVSVLLGATLWLMFYAFHKGHLPLLSIPITCEDSTAPAALCSPPDKLICKHVECISWSSELVRSMNREIDPCHDFFSYACQKWIDYTEVPPGRSSWSQFSNLDYMSNKKLLKLLQSDIQLDSHSEAVEKAKHYFTSCMNTALTTKEGKTPLREYINHFGGWPTLKDTNNLDLPQLLLKIHSKNDDGLFSMSVAIDDRDNKRSIITFDQSGLGIGGAKKYSSKSPSNERRREAYVRLGVAVATALGADKDEAEEDMLEVLEFETKLAAAHVSAEVSQDPSTAHLYTSIGKFQDMLGDAFDVSQYMNAMFNDEDHFPSTYEIDIQAKDYFKKLPAILDKTDKRTITNYFLWQVVQSMLPYLPSPFKEMLSAYQQVDSGTKTDSEGWVKCVQRTESVFVYATGAMYIKKHFDISSRDKVSKMVESLMIQFKKVLRKVSWMDENTRAKALEKANKMTFAVGFPDWIMKSKELDKYYSDLSVSATVSMFKNRERIKKWELLKNYDRLHNPKTKLIWSMRPQETNAYYSSNFNHMVFPAGILQPPFYHKDYPDSLNYGGIMFIIGHELTHGYDKMGKSYDGNGNLSPWWEDDTLAKFDEKSSCMAKQYSEFEWKGQRGNGNLTLDENIADNGGVKLSYQAFIEHSSDEEKDGEQQVLPGLNFNPMQLYYIKVAQNWCWYTTPEAMETELSGGVHSIKPFRVRGMLANFADFAKVFECERGSNMNPEDRCSVW